jgi:O-antigen/teichoic acid export membrane protein
MKGIILIPVLIKILDISTYGAYVLITTLGGFIVGISMLGISFKMTRFLPSSETIKDIHNNYYIPFYFHIFSIFIVSIILYFLWDIIIEPLSKDNIELLYTVFVLYLFSNVIYRYIPNYFRYTHRVGIFSISEIIKPYSEILIILFLAYTLNVNLSLDNLLMISVFVLMIISLPLLYKIIREINISIPKYSIDEFKGDFKLGFPLTLAYLVDVILAASDKFVIGYLLSATAVGYYAPAYAIGSLIVLVPKALGVALPQMMAKYKDSNNENEYFNLVNIAIVIHIILSVPFIIGSYFYSKEILELFTNKEIAEKGYLILSIVALSMFFYGINLIINMYLAIELKTKTIFRVNSGIAIFNLVANIVLISIYQDIIYAAYTTLISYIISNIFLIRYLNININFKKLFFNTLVYIIIMILLNYSIDILVPYHYLLKIGIITIVVSMITIFYIKNLKGLAK